MSELKMRKHMKERFSGNENFCDIPPLPNSLNIEINNTCNHQCVFCTYHGKYAPVRLKPEMMDYEMAKAIMEQAYSLGIGKKELGFYLSGEPFVHKDLERIIKCAKDIGFEYTFLTTNGALATPERMKKVIDAGLDSIRFSVNAVDQISYEDIHGRNDFDNVIENIKCMDEYLKKNNKEIATSLSCVITKKTDGIQDRIRELFGKYVDDILFIPVMVNELSCDESVRKEYQLLDDSEAAINEEFVCPMLFNTMYITPDLKVIPCCEAPGKDIYFYDLKKDFDLVKAWYSTEYTRYRNIFLKKADDTGTICTDCNLRKQGIKRLSLEKNFFE